MPIVRLKRDWPGNFTRYARDEDGARVKALHFTPGVPTLVQDADFEAVKDDIDAALELMNSSELEPVHANPNDAPRVEDTPAEKKKAEEPKADEVAESTEPEKPKRGRAKKTDDQATTKPGDQAAMEAPAAG